MTIVSLDIQQVEHEQSQQQKRLALGQCQSCGQQLYGFEKKSILRVLFGCKTLEDPFRKVPLTIPQLVERGQCLKCDAHRTSRSSQSFDSASAGSLNGRTSPYSTMEHPCDDLANLSPHNKVVQSAAMTIQSPPLSFVKSKVGQLRNNNNNNTGLLALGVPFPSPTHHRTCLSRMPPVTGGHTATYNGPYNHKGEKHGEGIMAWSNGDVYKGQFTNDRRSGHGVLTFASGSDTQQDNGEYVGDWVNDKMHGSGTRRYPNGDVYVGNYNEGKRQGEGRFYFANGDLYFGAWENNQMHGPGLYYFSSGVRFEGTFLYNKRNGKGKTQNETGCIDIFQYINDERVGQGVRFNEKRTHAWRLTQRNDGAFRQNGAAPLERHRITVAEAVSLVYEIEQAAQFSNDELVSSRQPK